MYRRLCPHSFSTICHDHHTIIIGAPICYDNHTITIGASHRRRRCRTAAAADAGTGRDVGASRFGGVGGGIGDGAADAHARREQGARVHREHPQHPGSLPAARHGFLALGVRESRRQRGRRRSATEPLGAPGRGRTARRRRRGCCSRVSSRTSRPPARRPPATPRPASPAPFSARRHGCPSRLCARARLATRGHRAPGPLPASVAAAGHCARDTRSSVELEVPAVCDPARRV